MVETFDCNKVNLKKGSRGAEVTLLQTHLKTLGYYTTYNGSYLRIDGIFGIYTEWALKKFQKVTGHTTDGWFGQKTCKSLNEKILEKNGITSTTNTTTTSSTTSTQQTSSTSTPVITIDKSKSPFTVSESNLHIEGLHFIASKVTPNTIFHNGNWKTLEMMDDTDYVYQGRPTPKNYTVEVYLNNERYNKCITELAKIGSMRCRVESDVLDRGLYFITVKVSNENSSEKKVSLDLLEYMGG